MDAKAVLLEDAIYEKSTAVTLEAHVANQIKQTTYDFAANKALLKNYQVNDDIMNVEVVSNILILSLMRLPTTDYLSLSYLIPPRALANTNIKSIQKCADLLERGKFFEFWEEYVNAPESLYTPVAGFVDAIRFFILSNIRDTYKSIPKSVLQQQLGLNDSGLIAYCDSNKFVEKVLNCFCIHDYFNTSTLWIH